MKGCGRWLVSAGSDMTDTLASETPALWSWATILAAWAWDSARQSVVGNIRIGG